MFKVNLHSVLMDIYYMTTKLGFSAEYIESISPAERNMYISYYIKDKEEEKKSQKTNTQIPISKGPQGE